MNHLAALPASKISFLQFIKKIWNFSLAIATARVELGGMTIYGDTYLHFHSAASHNWRQWHPPPFFQKNFPRWQNGRMTKNSIVEIVVIRRNDQKSHRSTASASIRHSLRIWSSFCWRFSLSRRPLTTRNKSSWSSSAPAPGQSILK